MESASRTYSGDCQVGRAMEAVCLVWGLGFGELGWPEKGYGSDGEAGKWSGGPRERERERERVWAKPIRPVKQLELRNDF